MSETMTVQCPSCDTSFPVDPDKVPAGGVRTRCTVCETQFRVDRPDESWPDSEGPADALAGLPLMEDTVPEPEVDDDADVLLEDGDEAEVMSDDVDPLADWVLETEDMAGFMTADEVMLSPEDLEMSVDEVETEDVEIHPEETPELPPLEPADEEPLADLAAAAEPGPETVLEDLDEVETVFEPDDAEELVSGAMATGEDDTLDVEDFGTVEEAGDTPSAEETESPASGTPTQGFQFGRRDPHEKARRLARVLVSDMITYNPERHATALERDTLQEDFQEEIDKSWAEYVEQVGGDLAESTPYWREALNEILAKGRPLF